MHLKKTNILGLAILAVFLFSCDKTRVFDEYKKLDGTWKKTDTLRFTFDQNDTINPYHLFLNVRNNYIHITKRILIIVSNIQK